MRSRTLFVSIAVLATVGCGNAGQPVAQDSAPPGPLASEAEPSDASSEEVSGSIRLYTSVTQDTVDAVLAAFAEAHPGVEVELFRAPTGELTARLAAEQREGGIRADVLWLTDPLSMHTYADEGLLASWTPPHASQIAQPYRSDTYWGTRLLNVVLVHGQDVEPAPTAWQDLTQLEGDVAIPDPGFAGSAFGALAFFALDDRFGFDYYEALEANGLVQVQTPGDVVTGVAEGRFAAGMTLDKIARDAITDGSPIEMVFPEPGAVAISSPIAVVERSEQREAAEAFVDFTLTREAQEAIASTGWQPVRDDVPWEHGGATVSPAWEAAFDQQEQLLERYRAIVGG